MGCVSSLTLLFNLVGANTLDALRKAAYTPISRVSTVRVRHLTVDTRLIFGKLNALLHALDFIYLVKV